MRESGNRPAIIEWVARTKRAARPPGGTLIAMTVRELREKYVRFFESKDHREFPSGSLIPYDVTGRLDESLLFNGAGMIQFKPYFRGVAKPDHPRLVTVQKCVRTGDIDEVGDNTHLTFFEMLGNFSFGDYFKREAIQYSWEFLTDPQWLGLDPHRLSFTVFEIDDEAEATWRECGATHVFRLGEETNYWPAGAFSNGPPGPCGPNSEMFYWVADEPAPGPGYTREDWERDEAAGKWVEIWNDVFIQYEWQGTPKADGKGYEKTGMPELPFRSIDTGMGLERTAMVLSGKKSVFDTDAFEGIYRRPNENEPDFALKDRAARIVADHVRLVGECLAAGIGMGPTGREYVVRKAARRAMTEGFLTGVIGHNHFAMMVANYRMRDPHFADLPWERRFEFENGLEQALQPFGLLLLNASTTIGKETMTQAGAPFLAAAKMIPAGPDGLSLAEVDYLRCLSVKCGMLGIKSSLNTDEQYHDFSPRSLSEYVTWLHEHESVARKLITDYFSGRRADELNRSLDLTLAKKLDGKRAFFYSDTHGIPIELIQRIMESVGWTVDMEAYERELAAAQARSRGAQDRETVYGGLEDTDEEWRNGDPEPTKFLGYDTTTANTTVIGRRIVGETVFVALDQTPFYAESGGQVADTGRLGPCDVVHVRKSAGVFWHELASGQDLRIGDAVTAEVDAKRRSAILPHHTGTHLLHLALHEVIGQHATQAGSYVGPDRLRFDFTHGAALTADERRRIEDRVRELARANFEVSTLETTPEEAKRRGAMALFGEKYGNVVRLVEVGPSKELCGGIHVRTSAEVLPFRILSESSAASGVRRIEAVAGAAAEEWFDEESNTLGEIATALKSVPGEVKSALERVQAQLREERTKREALERRLLAGDPGGAGGVTSVGSVKLRTQNFGAVDLKSAAEAVDNAVAQDSQLVFVAAVQTGDRVQFIAKAGPDAVRAGAHAGNLVKSAAVIAGGGGGGRPDFATAGGKLPDKITDALAAIEANLRTQVGE